MKSIGIITFHRSHNCGSVMQAYAMQKFLKDRYSLKSEFIDFSTPGQDKLYSALGAGRDIRDLIRKTGRLLIYPHLKSNTQSYDKYIRQHLRLSPSRYHSGDELRLAHLPYDAYITGSDQVWNVSIVDYDSAYFLDFVKDKPKISYAASFGARRVIENAANPKTIKNLIKDIDYVSVREPNGQNWLRKDFHIDSTVVLDPTLLLDTEDYLEAEEPIYDSTVRQGGYIFIYATKVSKEFEKRIQRLAQEKDLKIVIWQPDTWLKLGGYFKGYILPKRQNPGVYLSYIKHARYVFTASFHGVVFCAQYRKDFWILKNPGMSPSRDDRITSLVSRMGIEDRMLNLDKDIDLSLPASYALFEDNLATERRKSLQFLNEALNSI